MSTTDECDTEYIEDGICDDECNIETHDFDGGDCCLPEHLMETSHCEICDCLNK